MFYNKIYTFLHLNLVMYAEDWVVDEERVFEGCLYFLSEYFMMSFTML